MPLSSLAICKYFSLKFFGKKAAKQKSVTTILFIDNRFKFHFDQIAPFFKSGFLSASDTLLVSKFYFSSYAYTESLARSLGLSTNFFLFKRQIPNLDGKVVLYPYNGQTNCRLLLNRNAIHIFLTHGESNKKATINRMTRIYDHVLACGEIAVDRYLDFGIFSKWDIAHGRVIKLGDSLIAQLASFVRSGASTRDGNCLLYMPTWEGGLDEEDFSSVANTETANVLLAMCERLKVNQVLIQAHPNLGSRLPRYKNTFYSILCKLHDNGVAIFYAKDRAKSQSESLYRSIDNRGILQLTDEQSPLIVKYGVVDVSAAEAMLSANGIPNVVLYKRDKEIFAPRTYLDIRRHSMLCLDNSNWRKVVNSYVGTSRDMENQKKFFERLFSYSSESLLTMSHDERFKWLIRYVKQKKQDSQVFMEKM